VTAEDYSDEIKNAPLSTFDNFVGRIALDASCFATVDQLDPTNGNPGACAWIDSQNAIQALVDGGKISSTDVVRTDILVTCPFISYADAALELPPP
jgi:hypothetical protein